MVGLKIDLGAWALARFCAPWVSNAGEKEKNALSRGRKAFGARWLGATSESWQPAKAFFSFSPGNCLRRKKCAKAHIPRRAAIPGFLIDVPPEGALGTSFLGRCVVRGRGAGTPGPQRVGLTDAGRDAPPTCARSANVNHEL